MITLTVEAILLVLLVLIVMQFFKKKPAQPEHAGPQPDLANLKPTDARAGDVISISGAGDNLEDLDFTADRCTWMDAGARRWMELAGPYRERRVNVRVLSADDETEVDVHSDPKKITIEDLGLGENDLADMDERQNTADYFEYDGKNWLYRMSREVQTTTAGQMERSAFYCWEFREQGGNGVILVRKAEGEPFSVTRYEGVPAGNVTVYRGRM
jgi:hypothetical protein